MLKKLIVLFAGFFLQSAAFAQVTGTKIIELANVKYSCINASKELVNLQILSARAPKGSTFWQDVKGIGVRVDVQLSGVAGASHFPAAASIDTRDQNDKVIRTSLRLPLLDQMDLWDTTDGSASRTKTVNVPVTYVRHQGSSSAVKVTQALIDFTKTNLVGVPANPYSKGAQLFGEFFNTLNTSFQPDPKEVFDPNFQLSFAVGKQDTKCPDVALRQGVGVQIKDFQKGKEADGFIKVAQASAYCFYQLGDNVDPDIGFTKKEAAQCPATVPPKYTVLQNPQFIWLAYGTCKDEKSCTPGTEISGSQLQALSQTQTRLASVMSRLVKRPKDGFPNGVQEAIQNRDVEAMKKTSSASTYKFMSAIALCRSVGIAPEECFKQRKL